MDRESGEVRLNPKITSPRYYYLRQLRREVEKSISSIAGSDITVADYGCGNMPYRPIIIAKVSKYIGIDLPENPKADIKIDPVGKIELPDNSVDVVISTQVLEHVEDPIHYLSEAYRILKPGGKLLLTTHGYWMFHPDPTDYWRWTSTGLKKIVSERNFTIQSFTGIIGRSAMGLQLFQDGILFKLPKFLRPLWALFMQPLIFLFDQISSQESRNSDACTFIIIARK